MPDSQIGMAPLTAYERFVRARLAAGDGPNQIVEYVELAIDACVTDWAHFGDDVWRQDTVCPICGTWMAGICGHKQTPVLRSQYQAEQAAKGGAHE